MVDPLRALKAYSLDVADCAPIVGGLINETFLVTTHGGDKFVLQQLNPIFSPAVHNDIAAVTARLTERGLTTPRLIPTASGALWTEASGVWRLMSHVAGKTFQALSSTEQARSAGALLGRFHTALVGLEHEFENARLGVHDTQGHVRALRESRAERSGHARFNEVAPVIDGLLSAAVQLPTVGPLPDRVVHGDPKISNVIFEEDGVTARAFVDLDTLARMPVHLELGDAFRSWCNPGGESGAAITFSLEMFSGAIAGYAEAAAITAAERAAILPGIETIIVELGCRFARDALEESYFGWDRDQFESSSHHNQKRAQVQLDLVSSFLAQRDSLEAAVAAAFARP